MIQATESEHILIDVQIGRRLDFAASTHACADCPRVTSDYLGPNGGALCDDCAETRGLEVQLERAKRAAAEAERRAEKAANPPKPVDRLSALEERIRKLERRVWALEAASSRMR